MTYTFDCLIDLNSKIHTILYFDGVSAYYMDRSIYYTLASVFHRGRTPEGAPDVLVYRITNQNSCDDIRTQWPVLHP